MMQNGFRRIALAQGLLPERLPAREALTSTEVCEIPLRDPRNTSCTQPDAWEHEANPRVARPA